MRLAYESNYGSAANSMPSNMKNELLAILEVDFGQFCAGPSRERRYKVRSAIFRFSDRCPREMGTPQFGDPSPHIPSDMGTPGPHITRDMGPWGPQNSGDMGIPQ